MVVSSFSRVCVLLLAGIVGSGAVLAASAGDDVVHERKAKQALDDRADPNLRSDDVGKGTHMGSKATAPGTYIGDKSREAVRRYYTEHPPADRAAAAAWEIGTPLPHGAQVGPVPAALLATLPKAPPGVHYVRTGADILLVAASGMVVDGVKAP